MLDGLLDVDLSGHLRNLASSTFVNTSRRSLNSILLLRDHPHGQPSTTVSATTSALKSRDFSITHLGTQLLLLQSLDDLTFDEAVHELVVS